MLDLLAQTYTYTTTTTSSDTASGLLAGTFLLVLFLIMVPVIIFSIVCLWKTFEKAGVEGWKAIIPVYNGWVLAEIAGKPGWWGIVSLGGVIPVIGFIASIAGFVLYILIAIELSKKFGKDSMFSLLLILLPVIGFAILAFGSAKYTGSKPAVKPAAPAQV